MQEKKSSLWQAVKNFFSAIGKATKKPFQKFKKLKKPFKIALCIVLVAAIGAGATGYIKYRSAKQASSEENAGTSIVMQGSVVDSITGSGTVEPIEQRDIVPLVNGKITEAPFEEGDSVKVDDVLYKFEMTAAENAIETAQNNVEKARTTLSNRQTGIEKVQENISNLTVRATASGKISSLALNVGEEASGKICTITNYKEQTATIPFAASQINSIKIGDSAQVAIDKYMINTGGRVVRKYSAPETLSGGAVIYNVEILLDDTYVVEENVNVTATVNSSAGFISSASYGSVKYADPVTVNAEQKGKVSKVYFKNGDWVDKGDIIAVLTNSDLGEELKTASQNYKDAQMSLSEAESNLEDRQEAAQDYIVTSPIDGVILTKDYTVGDTVSGQNATTMMVVADMSKMKFTISVDELDIAKIQIGQSVQVTADALEGQNLQGEITSVSKLGTSSNGVTNYPVEVTIDQPGDLMPGMNVSAEIIVAQSDNCLYLPVSAVEYFGGKYYVTVVGEVENMPRMPQSPQLDTPGAESEEAPSENGENSATENGERPRMNEGGMPQRGEMPQRSENGEMPQRIQGENSGGEGEEKPSAENEGDAQRKMPEGAQSGQMPQRQEREEMKIKLSGKEERIEVEIGISNDEYYEIKSGVTLGQVVKNTSQTTSSSNTGMMGGMPGGMMGGMPGGMGGGMPGGMGGGMPGGMGGRR